MREPDVDGMLGRLTSRQLSEWMAFFNVHPYPDPWEINALLCSVVANVFGGRRRKYKSRDFMPAYRRSDRRERAQQMIGLMLARAQANAGASTDGQG
jgi:hypothetical protein